MSVLKINRFSPKVCGSSLLETLIAFGLISVILVLCTQIFVALVRDSAPIQRIIGLQLANEVLKKSAEEQDFLDKSAEFEEFIVKKTSTRHSDFPDCAVLTVMVYASGKKVAQLQQLYHLDEN